MTRYKFLYAMLVAATSGSIGLAQTQTYHVGNSLTWDMQPASDLEHMASNGGNMLATAYHIRCGESLEHIANHPSETCVNPTEAGKYQTALANETWDAVTLQPHHTADSTLKGEVDAAAQMIRRARSNQANEDTTFYVYAAWPRDDKADYVDFWTQSVADRDTQPTIHARDYFQHMMSRLELEFSGEAVDLQMVPVGEVLHEIAEKIESGDITGHTVSDLYRDLNHLSGQYGRLAATSTTYATLFADNPSGLRRDDQSAALSPFQQTIQQSAWDVVQNHPYTGVPEPSSAMILLAAAGLTIFARLRGSRIACNAA
jgi:hypothetical protein